MNTIIKLFSVLCLITVLSCSPPPEKLAYNETLCSDPWQTGPSFSDQEVEDAVKAYFEDKNIYVFSFSFSRDGDLQSCSECNCKVDRVIHVKADNVDVLALESEGFFRE